MYHEGYHASDEHVGGSNGPSQLHHAGKLQLNKNAWGPISAEGKATWDKLTQLLEDVKATLK